MARNFKKESKPEAAGNGGKPNRAKRRAANRKRDRSESNAPRTEAVQKAGQSFVNDISWYAKFPELLTAAANLPFPYKPGMPDGLLVGSVDGQNTSLRLPGVLAINWAPSIGKSQYASDPASLVAKQIYTQVRSVYSSELDADGPDFLVYLLCLDSIFSYLASLKRVYRLLSADNPFNYTVPEVALAATFSMAAPKDTRAALRRDRVKLYGAINELIYMLNRFRCPAIMDYFNRHYWMNDNIFGDSASPNAQLYMFVQTAYYKWTLGDSTDDPVVKVGTAVLTTPPTLSVADPVGDLFAFGRSLIDALSDAGSSYTISGYLTRAFPDAPQFMVDLLGVDDKQDIVYSQEVLSQIENVRVVGTAILSNPAATTVTQHVASNSVIAPMTYNVINPSSPAAQNGVQINPFLNLHVESPSAAEVTVASRLHALAVYSSIGGSATNYQVDLYTGSDYATSMTLYLAKPNRSGTMDTVDYVGIDSLRFFDAQKLTLTPDASLANMKNVLEYLQGIALLEQFDWHPIVVTVTQDAQQSNVVTGFNADIQNISSFSIEAFKQINRVCLYSEFNSFART